MTILLSPADLDLNQCRIVVRKDEYELMVAWMEGCQVEWNQSGAPRNYSPFDAGYDAVCLQVFDDHRNGRQWSALWEGVISATQTRRTLIPISTLIADTAPDVSADALMSLLSAGAPA